jgi:hypothetical protein
MPGHNRNQLHGRMIGCQVTMRILDAFFLHLNRFRNRLSPPRRYPAGNILVLLPHCLQNRECNVRLKNDVLSCKECGRCKMKELKALVECKGVQAYIAAGGREAQKRTQGDDVHIILAVACERELAEGIRATFPKRVVGVCNSWPNGPCTDTDIDVAVVESALDALIDKHE